ncbi:MAG: restriction endonuclease subunit S [Acidobacteriota bacterium]|nr:restriction endonuclease subunit S [Acidobacteriota bacterium]
MMEKYQFRKLDEVCKFLNGGTPSKENSNYFNGDIPWITGADIMSFLVRKVRSFITEKAIKDSATNLVPTGTVLLVTRTSVGKVAVAGMPLCFSQDITAIRNDEKYLDKSFLIYFLKTKESYFKQSARGATIGGITREIVSQVEIPLPSLDEQKRIATILDKADRLRRQRRFVQTLSDSFLQSVFIKMFGDPVSNPMNWETNNIGKYTSLVSSGSTPLGGETVYKKSGVRFIRSQNVLMSDFDFSDIAFIDEETHKSMKRTHVKKNDVLINITGASIGRVACYKEETIANVNQHVCIIRLKDRDILPSFLARQLSMPFYQTTVISSQSGATRQAFNFEQIKDFQIIAPPPPLQKKFAEIVQKFERVRRQQREATHQAEHLFQTLLHRAFRGEI